jgi:DNA modification methylase
MVVVAISQSERTGHGWRMLLGDCVERTEEIEDESVGLTIFSPPFPAMYTYSASERDMGNSRSIEELIDHYRFLIPGLLRTLMPGRSCCVHLCQSVRVKYLDGHSGLRDFRGAVISAMEEGGFVYYGEVTIDKDPQLKAIRTKDQGLLFKSLAADSSRMHMALADYLIQFRKPGENPQPIRAGISERYGNEEGWITPEEWIEWAAPVWYRASEHYPGGIRETDVLNVAVARENADERHIAPLQLGVIERAVKLWSNPGDLVFSPFAGIGSEGVGALRNNRRFVGIELKRSYFETACRNLTAAEGQLALS